MITVILVSAYMLLTAAFGVFIAKRNTSAAKFFVAKKNFGWALIATYIFSEMISGGGTIGIAQTSYTTGVSAVWTNWGMVFGTLVFLYVVTDFYYVVGNKMNLITCPEVIEFRFDRKCRVLVMAMLSMAYLIMFASNSKAIAVVVEAFTGISWKLWALLFGGLFIFFAITGGQQGVVYTNLVHSFVMLFGLGTAAIICLKYVGGIDVLSSSLPETYFDFAYPTASKAIAACASSCCSYIISPPLIAMVLGGKNKKAVKKGFWASAIIMFLFALFPAVIGICARFANPSITETASVIYVFPAQISWILGVVVTMAIVAALFSSSPAVLHLSSVMITNDLIKLIKPNMSDREQIRVTRIVIAILGIVCTLLGMNVQSHLKQMSGAYQIRAITGVVVLLSIFWGRIDSRAAFWSMLIGGIASAAWHFADLVTVTGVSPFWIALIFGIPVLLVLTYLNKTNTSEGFQKWKKLYSEAKEEHMI